MGEQYNDAKSSYPSQMNDNTVQEGEVTMPHMPAFNDHKQGDFNASQVRPLFEESHESSLSVTAVGNEEHYTSVGQETSSNQDHKDHSREEKESHHQDGRVMMSERRFMQETPIIAKDEEQFQPQQMSDQESASFTGVIQKNAGVEKNRRNAMSQKQGERIPRARRMKLSVTRVAPWSVAKVTFLMMIAVAIIQIVMVAVVWILLNSVGVFGKLTQIVASTGLSSNGFNLADFLTLPTILSGAAIFSIVEVIVVTFLAVIGAGLYNVVCSLVGGIRVTLGDD